jgi:predicted house-cleaning noncanonical NTP pyrophosphatase (MazG superfamily)
MDLFYKPPELIDKHKAKSLIHTVKSSRFKNLVDKVYNLYEAIRAFEEYKKHLSDNNLSDFLNEAITDINETIKSCNKGLSLMPSEKDLGENLFKSAHAIKALEIFCSTLLRIIISSVEKRNPYVQKEFNGKTITIRLQY